MNQQNFASLEASQRLYEAGIVLETDFYWFSDFDGSPFLAPSDEECCNGIRLIFPAPSMAEVWRELPEGITLDKSNDRENTASCLDLQFNGDIDFKYFSDRNPADALIDLLIWVRKERPC